MGKLWDKLWNDEDFALRAARGVAMAIGAFILAGGANDFIPREVAAGLMGIASMFSGNGRREG